MVANLVVAPFFMMTARQSSILEVRTPVRRPAASDS